MKKIIFLLALLPGAVNCFSQVPGRATLIVTDSLLDKEISLNKDYYWKYRAGDDTLWKEVSYNDSSWESRNPGYNLTDSLLKSYQPVRWFRMHIAADSSLKDKVFLLSTEGHVGATEIYWNGALRKKWGVVSADPTKEEREYISTGFVILSVEPGEPNLLCIRHSNHKSPEYYTKYDTDNTGVLLSLGRIDDLDNMIRLKIIGSAFISFLSCFFGFSGFIHLLLFFFYRSFLANLFYSLFCFLATVTLVFVFFLLNGADSDNMLKSGLLVSSFSMFLIPMLLGVTYHMFFERLTLFYKILVISMVPLAVLNLFGFDLAGNAGIALSVVALIDLIRVTVKAIRNRKPGSWIVGSGVLIVFASILALVLFFVIVFATTGKTSLSGWLGATFLIFLIFTVASIILSIPLSMSVYLARSFASVNRSLKDQLLRVRQLSEEKLQQELEKKRLLEVRSEELERKVSERTSEVVKQKEEIEIKNKYLTDSINYARRIQTAILPAEEQYKEVFEEAFVLYLPKDIVSGDFYWMHKRNDLVFVAVADCTGHGISGAFMSMIGNTLLNEIIVEKGITETGHILDLLHEGIKKSLKQDGQNNANDGMDIAICRISPGIGEEVLFSGAMRPLYIGGAEGMREVRPDKFSIGGFREEERKFTTVRPEVKKGEMLYLFTDGYADQFGGEKGKKFMSRNFQKLLEQISGKAADEQKLILENTYLQWKGNNEQVDDILVVGVRMI